MKKTIALCLGLVLSAAMARAENSVDAVLRRGNRFYQKKDFARALEEYDRAKKIAPNDPRSSFNRGAALYQLQRGSEAQEEFAAAAQLNPALSPLAKFNEGNVHFRDNKLDEAIAAYREALRQNPKDENARWNLQVALALKKSQPQNQKQQPQNGDSKNQDQKKSEEEKRAAAQILKSASGQDQGNKPLPLLSNGKNKKQKPNESNEDW